MLNTECPLGEQGAIASGWVTMTSDLDISWAEVVTRIAHHNSAAQNMTKHGRTPRVKEKVPYRPPADGTSAPFRQSEA
jgi:hypothetical protein